MNSRLEGLFLHEIIFQCKTILTTFDLLSNALKQNIWDNNLIWGILSLILTSTSNISKIFWPSTTTNIKYKERGEHLRDLLQVDNESSLHNRYLRNDFEHYDERLHDWYEKSSTKSFSSRNINITMVAEIPDGYVDMGNFDTHSNTVTFWNVRYELDLIKSDIENLLNIAETKYN
jgi:hypothetical protein